MVEGSGPSNDADQYVILGVDPGLNATGWGVLWVNAAGAARLAWGVLRPPRGERGMRLLAIREGIAAVIAEHQPLTVAIEHPFLKANVRTAVALGQAQAAVFLAAAEKQLPVSEYAPREVKQAVSGDGNAEKRAVQEALRLRLNLAELDAPADAADALAVAFCHYLLGTPLEAAAP